MFNSLMLSIFDTAISRITTAIIVLLVVGTIIFFFIKSSKFRVFCGYFLIFVLVVGGVFSGYHLNKYYNTKGGIVGQLTEIFNDLFSHFYIRYKELPQYAWRYLLNTD